MQLISQKHCAWRARLSPSEMEIYDRITSAAAERKRVIRLPRSSDSALNRVFLAVRRDQPCLFDLDRQMWYSQGLMNTTLHLNYLLSDEEAAEWDRLMISKLRRMRNEILDLPNVLYRERVLHDQLVKMGISAGDPHDWKTHCIAGPLLYGSTVCEGMAALFYLLCLVSGVPCCMIEGEAKWENTERHSWNIVRLGREYAHVDVFWDMSQFYPQRKTIPYDYFNLSDQQIGLDHVWKRSDYPACPGERYSYFSLNGLNAASEEEIFRIACQHLRQGKRHLLIRVNGAFGQEVLSRQVEKALSCIGQNCTIISRINENQHVAECWVEIVREGST